MRIATAPKLGVCETAFYEEILTVAVTWTVILAYDHAKVFSDQHVSWITPWNIAHQLHQSAVAERQRRERDWMPNQHVSVTGWVEMAFVAFHKNRTYFLDQAVIIKYLADTQLFTQAPLEFCIGDSQLLQLLPPAAVDEDAVT